MITTTLAILQAVIGLAILVAAIALAASSVDRLTRVSVWLPLIGLQGWAAWFSLQPLSQGPDSAAAIALAALVAWVLIRHRDLVVRGLGLTTKVRSEP